MAPPPHQPSPDGSTSATPPQGGSDTRGANRGHRLHFRLGTWFTPCPGYRARSLVRRSRITPPLRGSRQDKGGARSRAGGGQTPRPVSECQRHGQRSAGGEIAASSQHAMPLQNAANYLSRPRFRQAISATGGEVLRICGERSINLYFLARLSALVEVDQRPNVFSFLQLNVVFSDKFFVSFSMAGELHLKAMKVVIERYRT